MNAGTAVTHRHDEIALIFAILVIHDDDDFAILNGFDGFWKGVQG